LFGRFDKRKPVDFASDSQTKINRTAIDTFLIKVLPEEEHEFIESYWISDEATILDCSMADPETLFENVKKAYDVTLSRQELRMSLHVLVDYVNALSK
jgi:hypothetical protein